MIVAIFGNTLRPTVLSVIQLIADFFSDKEVDLLLDKDLHDFHLTNNEGGILNTGVINDDNFTADLVLSIGGDGTFLTTAARVGAKNIPILGINLGRLGFLADVDSDELDHALHAILDNKLSIEHHTVLKVECSDGREIPYPYALNDVSILKSDGSSMMGINTYLNGEAVNTYHADGLIIATPTGSTAYSMSVGGPIVAIQSSSILLSPVASHGLTVRPLVVPDSWIIDMQIDTRSGCFQVSLDGRSMVLDQGVGIRVTKGEHCILVAKQQNHTFFDTLKSKLMWGLDNRN